MGSISVNRLGMGRRLRAPKGLLHPPHTHERRKKNLKEKIVNLSSSSESSTHRPPGLRTKPGIRQRKQRKITKGKPQHTARRRGKGEWMKQRLLRKRGCARLRLRSRTSARSPYPSQASRQAGCGGRWRLERRPLSLLPSARFERVPASLSHTAREAYRRTTYRSRDRPHKSRTASTSGAHHRSLRNPESRGRRPGNTGSLLTRERRRGIHNYSDASDRREYAKRAFYSAASGDEEGVASATHSHRQLRLVMCNY